MVSVIHYFSHHGIQNFPDKNSWIKTWHSHLVRNTWYVCLKKMFTTFLSDRFYRRYCKLDYLFSFLLKNVNSFKLYVILHFGTNTYEIWTENRPISKFYDKYTFFGSSEYDLIDSTVYQSDHLQNKQKLENF